MGDFLSPQKRELVDRLRRRIEGYRQHHSSVPNGTLARYQRAIDCLYAQQRRDTEIYHRKWVDSKAKKAAKSTRASKDGVNSQSNQLLLKKRKLDSTSSATSDPCVDQPSVSYSNAETGSPSSKRTKTDSENQAHVSVQIYQKSSQPDSHINVTVSSTFKSGNSGSPSGGQKIHASTSVECKTEPTDDQYDPRSNHTLSPQESDIGDELNDILDLITQENGGDIFDKNLQSLLEEHDNDIDNVIIKSDEIPDDLNMFSPGSMQNASSPMAPPPQYSDSIGTHPEMNRNMHQGHHTPPSSMTNGAPLPSYQPPQSQGHQQTPVSAPYFNHPNGPAAETLKQLAMKNSQGGTPVVYQRQGNYPGYPGQQNFSGPPQSSNMYAFNGGMDPRQAMGHKNLEMLSYGGTKPLSHFSDPMTQGGPQQIPHPMRSRGAHPPGQGAHIQVNHMQNMSVPHGMDSRRHMQMSQQMQASMQGPGQISMSQQQSFNMAQSEAAYRNEQLKMKLLQQQKMQQEQQQQQQAMMKPQYPSRPPPEYKMPQAAPGYQQQPQQQQQQQQQGQGPNHPLQTIQNMIKQTSETFNSAVQQGGIYGNVKTENAAQSPISMQSQGSMPTQPLSHMPSGRNISPQVAGPHHDSFQGQQVSRQQSFPGNPPGVASHALQPGQPRPTKPATPTYTSALMRNERPPNVNVGPAGLNISQQRLGPNEWAPRSSSIPTNYKGPMPHNMPSQNMQPQRPQLQYSYPNQSGGQRPTMPPHPQHAMNIQMAQQSMMGTMMPNGSSATIHAQQHQQMMMQQSMRMPHHPTQGMPNINVSQSVAMAGSQSVSFQQQPVSGHDSYPSLDFLEQPQHGPNDFLDQMAQGGDFNILDDILGP